MAIKKHSSADNSFHVVLDFDWLPQNRGGVFSPNTGNTPVAVVLRSERDEIRHEVLRVVVGTARVKYQAERIARQYIREHDLRSTFNQLVQEGDAA